MLPAVPLEAKTTEVVRRGLLSRISLRMENICHEWFAVSDVNESVAKEVVAHSDGMCMRIQLRGSWREWGRCPAI